MLICEMACLDNTGARPRPGGTGYNYPSMPVQSGIRGVKILLIGMGETPIMDYHSHRSEFKDLSIYISRFLHSPCR